MTDEERQHMMDFILQRQAQFAAGMQRLEEADARADKRLNRLERTVVLMARQFRRERQDLRERINALVDAQVRSEDRLTRLEEITERNSEAIERNSAAIERNTEAIELNAEAARRAMQAAERADRAAERASEDISRLAKLVEKIARRQNGDGKVDGGE